MWVARDKDIVSEHGGTLNLFEFLPYRLTVGKKNPKEFWSDYSTGGDEMELDENEHSEFKNLKWEDEPIEVCLVEKSKHHICYMKEVSGEVTAITERLFLELLYKGYPIIKQTEKYTIIQNYFNYVDSKR